MIKKEWKEKGFIDSELPEELRNNKTKLKEEIKRIAKEKDAIILAHYYTVGDIQDIADFVGDSLALARKGYGDVWCTLYGRDMQDSFTRKTRAYARSQCWLFACRLM